MTKILVVDDEPEVVKGLTVRLKHWGYEVISAIDADSCMLVLEKEKPDLVLLDVLMPKIDGIRTCSMIKNKYDMPVIMVTVLNNSEVKHDANLFGAFEFVNKPIDESDLKAKIEKALKVHNERKNK